MLHPEIMRFLADEHVAGLRAAARRPIAPRTSSRATDIGGVELRLCTCADDLQLAHLAELEGRPVPFGRFVVAIARGRIVAALPLAGGHPLADPFVSTEHPMPLLELRASQLREPDPRRGFFPRSFNLIRAALHA
jgi:hypothetical protein